jgi:spore coat protein U-like protein
MFVVRPLRDHHLTRAGLGAILLGTFVAGAGWLSTTSAATVTANVTVTATVTSNCLVNAGAVAFGNYDPFGTNDTANLDVDGSFSLRCTRGTPAVLSLSNGGNFSGGTRRMSAGGGNFLNYQLYTTAARTTVWNTTNTVSYSAASRALFTQPIYGRVPGAQDAAIGTYTDTVVATVTF